MASLFCQTLRFNVHRGLGNHSTLFSQMCVFYRSKWCPCLLAWALTSSHQSARHFGIKARYLRHFALKRRCITMSQTLLLLAWPQLLVGRAAGDLHLKSPFPRHSGVNPPLGLSPKCQTLWLKGSKTQTLCFITPISGCCITITQTLLLKMWKLQTLLLKISKGVTPCLKTWCG